MNTHIIHQPTSPAHGRKHNSSFSGNMNAVALFTHDHSPLPLTPSSVCLSLADAAPGAAVDLGVNFLILSDAQFQTIKSLLLRIWPKERVVIGLRTCKWLRAGLIERANATTEFHAKGHQGIVDVDEDEIVHDLQRFSHGKNQIAFKCGQKMRKIDSSIRLTLFSALTTAIPSLGSSLVDVDLSAWGKEITDDGWCMLAAALVDCRGLERLDLSLNDLGDEAVVRVVAALSDIERLSSLNLMGNQIGKGVESLDALAAALGKCKWLAHLDLSHNPLGNDGLQTLLPAICSERLVRLNLDKVSVLSRGFEVLGQLLAGCPMLTHLSIKNNDLVDRCDSPHARSAGPEQLQPGLASCIHLTELDLSWNRWGGSAAAVLGLTASLAALRHLRALNLAFSGVGAGMGAAGSTQLAEALGVCCDLRTLNLEENKLGALGFKGLADVLRAGRLPRLEVLDIAGNILGPRGAEYLAHALQSGACSSLRSLNLARNVFEAQGMASLSKVFDRCPRLENLNMGGNTITQEGSAHLGEAVSRCAALTRLELGRNELLNEGAGQLALSLPSCTALQYLDLSENGIGVEGAANLAGMLTKCPKLATLCLGKNSVSDHGCSFLSMALPRCPALTCLGLQSNDIGPRGCSKIAAALSTCAVSALNLAENSVGDEGATQLANALGTRQRPMQLLKLCANSVGSAGAIAVSASVLQFRNVRDLGLSMNKIDNTAADALGKVVRECRTIESLDLRGNDFGEAVRDTLKNPRSGMSPLSIIADFDHLVGAQLDVLL